MIRFVYYALCKNGILPILGDYKNKRMNLILNESKEIYLSFDGFVPDDIQNAYVIHTQDEEPNRKYLNYYPEECCLKEAVRILRDIFDDCEIEKIIEFSAEANVNEYFNKAMRKQNENYALLLKDYLISSEEVFYPPEMIGEVYIKNWFEMQDNHYSITYMYNDRETFVLYDDFEWGNWGYYFSACSKWQSVNKQHAIPQNAKLGETPLGGWITEQRTAYRKKYLSEERKKLLINISFSFNTYNDGWEEKRKLLIKYKTCFGNTNIEKRAMYEGEALGIWCVKQRKDEKDGKLTEERKQKLLDIGFDFNPLETEWNRRFEQYKRYIAQTGQYHISRATDFEGEHLGAWVETQRKQYTKGKMSDERINHLLSINPNIFSLL